MNSKLNIKYNNQSENNFPIVLREKVNYYFKSKNISRKGNFELWIKTLVMFSLYFIPYFILLSNMFNSPYIVILIYIIMGIGLSGIGLSVMHDACHNSYSSNPTINKIMSYSLNMLGGNNWSWKIQHNVLHHSFTNIKNHDEDIDHGIFLRFSPHQKYRKFYKYQYLYAWFLYGLMTVIWLTIKDFKKVFKYKKENLIKTQGISFKRFLLEIIITKIIFFSYILVIPIIVMNQSWTVILLGLFLMCFVSGIILSLIFQPAHIMPELKFPIPDDNGNLDNNMLVHQLLTTSNFAMKNRILTWFCGGLNFQIEHHLFPTICHVHYRGLSKIVKKVTQKFGMPYNYQPTFSAAIYNHAKMLFKLGRNL